MIIGHLRLALATAALTAALAATSCGSQSLNEDLGDDIDLYSSTDNSAQLAAAEASAAARQTFDLILDGPVQNSIMLENGSNAVDHDSYSDSLNAHEYEAVVGTGFDGMNWLPIEEEVLGLHSEPVHYAFARWDFQGLIADHRIIKYVHLYGSGQFSEKSGYYLAVSNHEDGDWEIYGPYHEFGSLINIKDVPAVSEAGNTSLAVIVYGGDHLELRGMNLYVGHPQTEAAD